MARGQARGLGGRHRRRLYAPCLPAHPSENQTHPLDLTPSIHPPTCPFILPCSAMALLHW